MAALLTPYAKFLSDWLSVNDESTPSTHPELFKQIFEVRDRLDSFFNKLDTVDGSKEALDYLNEFCKNTYSYIFMSDLFHDFNLVMGRTLGFEPEVEDVHNSIFKSLEFIKTLYDMYKIEDRNRCVRFYARCVDEKLGPEERDRLLLWIEKPSGSYPKPITRWCKYGFMNTDYAFIIRILNLGKRTMTDHEIRYLKDHIKAFRQRLIKAVRDRDLRYIMFILNSQYSRYFHVFAADILNSAVTNMCQSAAPPGDDEHENKLSDMEDIVSVCLNYNDWATEKARVFYQLTCQHD